MRPHDGHATISCLSAGEKKFRGAQWVDGTSGVLLKSFYAECLPSCA